MSFFCLHSMTSCLFFINFATRLHWKKSTPGALCLSDCKVRDSLFWGRHKPERALLPLNILPDLHICTVTRAENNGLLLYNKKKWLTLCTMVFLMCVRDLAKTRSSLWNRGIVLWSPFAITLDLQHCLCSCGINDHYYHQTGNSQAAALAGFLFMVMKASLGAEAATRPRWTVLGWGGVQWQKRSPGWKVVKYNVRAKSYSLVYVSAARTGGGYTTGLQGLDEKV